MTSGLVVAISQVFVAYLLFKFVVRKAIARDERERLRIEQLRAKLLIEETMKKIDQTIKTLHAKHLPGLDTLVLEDAIKREARAKAALAATLKENGCSQSQIDEVMQRIDNQQHAL